MENIGCSYAPIIAGGQKLLPGVSIVEQAPRFGEDEGEARIVGGHHLGLGRALPQRDNQLDVLHTPERLLPQLQLTGHLKPITPDSIPDSGIKTNAEA